jgi:hypothetical protein
MRVIGYYLSCSKVNRTTGNVWPHERWDVLCTCILIKDARLPPQHTLSIPKSRRTQIKNVFTTAPFPFHSLTPPLSPRCRRTTPIRAAARVPPSSPLVQAAFSPLVLAASSSRVWGANVGGSLTFGAPQLRHFWHARRRGVVASWSRGGLSHPLRPDSFHRRSWIWCEGSKSAMQHSSSEASVLVLQ